MSFWCKMGFHDWIIVRETSPQIKHLYFVDRVCYRCKKVDLQFTRWEWYQANRDQIAREAWETFKNAAIFS